MSFDLFHGHSSVRFEEPDIAAIIPACVPILAAALAHGWRLARDGAANHMDVLHGCSHLTDFKRASRRQLQRSIFFRFRPQVLRVIDDQPFRVEQFIARCQADAAFFRAAQQHPRHERRLRQLQRHMQTCARHLMVADPEAHDRNLIVPITGGDKDLIARLAGDYEGGW